MTNDPTDLDHWPTRLPERWHDLVAETLEAVSLTWGEGSSICFDPEFQKTVARDLRDRLIGRSPTYAES